MTKQYLKFKCGARIPAEGYLPEPYVGHGRPNKKGLYRLVVFAAPSHDITRPVRRDGADARCFSGCCWKRASGRRSQDIWLDTPDDAKGTIITCYPEVIEDE
jgi:hypothetical protein